MQEAKAASTLNHPNIVTIHDIAAEAGRDFMAMEYVAGRSLDHLIGRNGLKLGEALKYAVPMADALAAGHGAGIMHRDLKPGNVMVEDRRATPLWKAPAEGGPETQVLPSAYWVALAVTKHGICFCRPDPPRYWVEFASIATGRISRITEVKSSLPGMSVSPDGRWLLYAQDDGLPSDLMLVENFR